MKGARLSVPWIAAGALAALGAVWIELALVRSLLARNEVTMLGAQAIACSIAGALLLVCSVSIKPWREPVVAMLVAYLASTVILLSSPILSVREMFHTMPAMAVRVVVSCASALSGAVLVRRFAPTLRPGGFLVFLLSGLVTVGFVATLHAVEVSLFGTYISVLGVTTLVVAVLAVPFAIQSLLDSEHVVACGAGSLLVFVKLVSDAGGGDTGELVGLGLPLLGLWWLGTKMAKRAWARNVRLGRTGNDVPVMLAR